MDAVNLNHDVATVSIHYTIDELKKISAFKVKDVLGCISKITKGIATHKAVNGRLEKVEGIPGHQELIQLSQGNETIPEFLDT